MNKCRVVFKLLISKVFNKSDYCEIAAIGPFNKVTFGEIQIRLRYTKVEILSRETDSFLVELDNKNTKVLLWFNLNGTFKRIESEYWKDLKISFNSAPIK